MSDLVARTGRHQQRYEDGYRLVAGCVPFRYKSCEDDSSSEKIVEVLMINSPSGPGLLFPKGGWENDETVEEAAVREAIEEAGVRGDLMECLGYYEFRSKTHQDESVQKGCDQNRSAAQNALNKNGIQINGVLIIGVKPLDPMQRQALTERLNNQGFMPLPLPTARHPEVSTSKAPSRPYYLQNGNATARQTGGTIASPTKSLASKIMDLMFAV